MGQPAMSTAPGEGRPHLEQQCKTLDTYVTSIGPHRSRDSIHAECHDADGQRQGPATYHIEGWQQEEEVEGIAE